MCTTSISAWLVPHLWQPVSPQHQRYIFYLEIRANHANISMWKIKKDQPPYYILLHVLSLPTTPVLLSLPSHCLWRRPHGVGFDPRLPLCPLPSVSFLYQWGATLETVTVIRKCPWWNRIFLSTDKLPVYNLESENAVFSLESIGKCFCFFSSENGDFNEKNPNKTTKHPNQNTPSPAH